jgi:ABC-type lipoprotein release transport system permease subunit
MALPLSYNWRNLFVRKLSTSLTFAVVATLVLVLCVLLSFAAGIRASLSVSGWPQNVLVLKPGATAESTSIISPDEKGRVVQAPGIAHGADGKMLISEELCTQTSIPRRGGDRNMANVAVRGVDATAFAVHPEVKIIEGRNFEPGQLEVIVGKSARDRFDNLGIGGEVRLGRQANRQYKVVGVFDTGGGAFDSEIWGGRTQISDSFNRHFISSAVLRLDDPAAAATTIAYLNGPAVALESKRETEYYEELSKTTREIVVLTTVLIAIMSIGAAFAVANTMYAAVDGRRREIAMLRTIGFGRGAIILSFVTESLLVCVTACLVGLAGASLFSGARQDFLSSTTWTVLAYELKITPGIALGALGLACLVGVMGAIAPALRASRVRVIEALRKA